VQAVHLQLLDPDVADDGPTNGQPADRHGTDGACPKGGGCHRDRSKARRWELDCVRVLAAFMVHHALGWPSGSSVCGGLGQSAELADGQGREHRRERDDPGDGLEDRRQDRAGEQQPPQRVGGDGDRVDLDEGL
jgi:hypothetical protein